MNKGKSGNKNHRYFLMVFLLMMRIILLLQYNAIFLLSEIIKRITCLSCLNCVLKRRQYIFFSFLIYKIFVAIVWLFFWNIFQSFTHDGQFIPFQLYLSIKGLIFDIIREIFPISLWFTTTVAAYRKHFWSYMFIGFAIGFLLFI